MEDNYVKERIKILNRRIKELAEERKELLEDQRRCRVEKDMLKDSQKARRE